MLAKGGIRIAHCVREYTGEYGEGRVRSFHAVRNVCYIFGAGTWQLASRSTECGTGDTATVETHFQIKSTTRNYKRDEIAN